MSTNSFPRRLGVARVINKAGLMSRSQAEAKVAQGVVQVNGTFIRDPEFPTLPTDKILIEGVPLQQGARIYLMLNKPRGLVTSASDEQGRATIYQCLEGKNYPHVGPVGRLDKASEGILLLTNDTEWANAVLDPECHISKIYHVQVRGLASASLLMQMESGILDQGERLCARKATLLRSGARHSWIEVVLEEGKNREIRRMLDSQGFEVLRLVRVAIGTLELGDLPKGAVRELRKEEWSTLRNHREES